MTTAASSPERQVIDLSEALKKVFKMYPPIIGISLDLILEKLIELPSPYKDLHFLAEELDSAFEKLFQRQPDGFQIGIRIYQPRYSRKGSYPSELQFNIEHPKHRISFYWRQGI